MESLKRQVTEKGIAGWMLLFVLGLCILCWFLWPALWRGIINTGTICGILLAMLCMAYALWHRQVHQWVLLCWESRRGRAALVILAGLVLIGLALCTAAVIAILKAGSGNIPQNTPAIVLGCSVKGDRPSRVLQERIDAAAMYLEENPDAIAVLSGGQGPGEDITEAACMYQGLVEKGIDKKRLYQEGSSENTRENLENAKKILEQLGLVDEVTIITSEFHLYRGKRWANSLGLFAYGYGAHTDLRYLPTFFVREVVAVVHVWLTA